MKKTIACAAALLAMAPALVFAGEKHNYTEGDVFSPAKHVICDRPGGMCASSEKGVSLRLTYKYLGDDTEDKLEDEIYAHKNFDRHVFGLSNGTTCKIKEKKCYFDESVEQAVEGNVDETTTHMLFGSN